MIQEKDYTMQHPDGSRIWWYRFNGTTPKGERLVVSISECRPSGKQWGKHDLPTIWKKKGYTKELLPDYLGAEVFVYEPDGSCFMMYNPQTMISYDGNRYVIDFDWLLPVSEENKDRLLSEIVRRANNGTEPKREINKEGFIVYHNAFKFVYEAYRNGKADLRSRYRKSELVLHLLLQEEVYYVWSDAGIQRVLGKAQEVYTDTTLDDIKAVYERNKEMITAIYG